MNLYICVYVFGTSYSYYFDSSGRLKSSATSLGEGYDYTYDNNGNLLKKKLIKNLIFNPNFDKADHKNLSKADVWEVISSKNTGFELLNDAATGEKAQKIWDSDLGTGHFSGISQKIQVAGGKLYSASVQVQIREIKGASVQLYIDFQDAQNQYVGTHIAETSTANWEYVTLNIRENIPVTAVSARVYIILRSKSSSGSGNFVVDTANFEYGTKQNLLVNGSLEQQDSQANTSADGWSRIAAANTGFELLNDAANGEKAQKIWDSDLPTGHFSGISQKIQVAGGKPYSASVQVQIREIKGASVQLYIDFQDAQNQFVGTHIAETATANWEYVTLNIRENIPSTAVTARVYIILRSKSVNGAGNFVVDTANFEYGAKQNLLVNDSLEQLGQAKTSADGWSRIAAANTGFELLNDAATGEKAQKIWDSDLPTGHFSGISQKIQVAGGKPYSASVQVQIREIKGASVQLYIDFQDAQNQFVGTHIAETSTANWEYVTLNIRENIPATAVTARVYIILRSKSASGSGNFVVDTAYFEYGTKQNLLVNGSLKQQDSQAKTSADGWSRITATNTGFELLNDAATGEKAQKIWDSDLPLGHFSGISQKIQVAGGKLYSASAQVQIREIKGASVQLYIDYQDAQNQFVGTHIAETATANREYVTLNIKQNIPATAVTARVYIILRSKSASGSGNFVVNTVNFQQ